MNRLVRIVAGRALLVAVLTLVGAYLARPTRGSPSVTCVGVTNDGDGTRMVEVVTRVVGRRSFGGRAHSMDVKVDGVWRTNLPLPEAVKAELELLPFDAKATGGFVLVPTNAPWRIWWEIVEARSGVEGLKERLRYPQGYRRRGGWLNVLTGVPARSVHWAHVAAGVRGATVLAIECRAVPAFPEFLLMMRPSHPKQSWVSLRPSGSDWTP